MQFCFFDGLVGFSFLDRAFVYVSRPCVSKNKQIIHVVVPIELVSNLAARVVTVVSLPYSEGGKSLRMLRADISATAVL